MANTAVAPPGLESELLSNPPVPDETPPPPPEEAGLGATVPGGEAASINTTTAAPWGGAQVASDAAAWQAYNAATYGYGAGAWGGSSFYPQDYSAASSAYYAGQEDQAANAWAWQQYYASLGQSGATGQSGASSGPTSSGQGAPYAAQAPAQPYQQPYLIPQPYPQQQAPAQQQVQQPYAAPQQQNAYHPQGPYAQGVQAGGYGGGQAGLSQGGQTGRGLAPSKRTVEGPQQEAKAKAQSLANLFTSRAKQAQGGTTGGLVPKGDFSIKPTTFAVRPQLWNGNSGAGQTPAYVSVNTPSLGPRKAAAGTANGTAGASAASQGSANPKSWPASLRAYVERAFAQCSTAASRGTLQVALKQLINDAQAKGELWMRNWQDMPLPVDGKITLPPPGTSTGGGPASYAANAAAKKWQPAQYSAGLSGRSGPSPLPQKQQQWGQWRKRGRSPSPTRGRSRSPGRNKGRSRRSSSSSSYSRSSSSSRSASPPRGQQRGRQHPRRGFRDRQLNSFNNAYAENRVQRPAAREEVIDWENYVVKGTYQGLEKSYFRLTSAPDPGTVRPPEVLRLALARLVRLLADGAVNYTYAVDQFKGMRQDCTVQHLRNDIATAVYEAHARCALEHGDSAEYLQCQAQLEELYREIASSSLSPNSQGAGASSSGGGAAGVGLGCRAEFVAYRLLYQTLHAIKGQSTAIQRTLLDCIQVSAVGVSGEEGAALISHARAVREALLCSNYAAFFKLRKGAPRLSRALMDTALDKTRFAALTLLTKALRPILPVHDLAVLVGFIGSKGPSPAKEIGRTVAEGPGVSEAHEPPPGASRSYCQLQEADEATGTQECLSWLAAAGAVVTSAPAGAQGGDIIATLDCKASAGVLQFPDPASAPAVHKDTTLALDDFLKRLA